MFKKINALFIMLILSLLLFSGCKNSKNVKSSRFNMDYFALNTHISISTYDSNHKAAIQKAFDEISRIEDIMSKTIDSSEIYLINENAGLNPVKVSLETFDIIKSSIEFSQLSKGGFDITLGIMTDLWDVNSENPKVPNETDIISSISLVDFNQIELNDYKKTVFLKKENMKIDLGGIAKGYAADRAYQILKDEGIKSAILNLGGNVYAMGLKPNNEKWKVGITDPFTSVGGEVGIVSLQNQTIVTSGIYERYFEVDKKKYHHIIDPKTGYPVENEVMSVSVIADSSLKSDALSTTLLVLGVEEGLKLVESLENTECVFINKNKEIFISSGLKNNFSLSKKDFKIQK